MVLQAQIPPNSPVAYVHLDGKSTGASEIYSRVLDGSMTEPYFDGGTAGAQLMEFSKRKLKLLIFIFIFAAISATVSIL